mmetsp:Transcript_21029/g.35618  ORF Transcript_21029/g.35618 Transcript_21029/m.35618 type:complete len:297 (-) Transcript_21029:266-1156(-)
MGSAASTIPDTVNLDQFKSVAGERFSQEYYDANKDADGNLTKAQLIEFHDSLKKLNRYKLKSRMKLADVYYKWGEWYPKIINPAVIIEGDEDGCVEIDGQQMTFRGKFSNDTIESYWLHLADGSGYILGWNTTYQAKKMLDSFVTDVDEKPIVVHPLPAPVKPKPDKPKPPPPSKDDAAKKIQKVARQKSDRKKNPKPKPPPKKRAKKKPEPKPGKKKSEPKPEPKPALKKYKAERGLNAVDSLEENKANGYTQESGTVFEILEEKTHNGIDWVKLADGHGWVMVKFSDTVCAAPV